MRNLRALLVAVLLLVTLVTLGSGCAIWNSVTSKGTLNCSCSGMGCDCSHCTGEGLECRCSATDAYPDTKVGPSDDEK